MPKLKNRLPKICRDRNQSFSWHNGKRFYHGVWGSPEAEKSYKRFITALLENPAIPSRRDEDDGSGVLVSELATGYLDHIENSQMHPSHVLHFKNTVGYLVELYGDLAVNEFSPKKLKVVRGQMVKTGKLCRKVVNDYARRIVCIFQWGVEEELVHETVYNALRVVKTLSKRTPGTFDHPKRQEVPDDVVLQTLPFMSPTVAAMVQVQRLTGSRPSEIFSMRVGDIDQSRKNGLWYYTPESHKTQEHIGEKSIPLGKPEQKLIAPYLVGKKPEAAIFSPRTAMEEWHAARRANRKTKVSPSQQARNQQRAKKPRPRQPGEFYNRNSYRVAILNAIKKGNKVLPEDQRIPHWSPYLLRNAAATAIELEHGLDEAQAQLGHTSANMTKRYSKAQLRQREKLAHSRVSPFEKPEE